MESRDQIETFDREFRDQLERFTDVLIQELRSITSATLPAGVGAIGFCQDADWGSFPVYTYVMDASLRRELVMPMPYESLLLRSAGPLVQDDAIDQDAFEDGGVHTYERGARLLSEWFAECWHRAGGANVRLPAFIHLHDAHGRYYDLLNKRWVEGLQEVGKPAAT